MNRSVHSCAHAGIIKPWWLCLCCFCMHRENVMLTLPPLLNSEGNGPRRWARVSPPALVFPHPLPSDKVCRVEKLSARNPETGPKNVAGWLLSLADSSPWTTCLSALPRPHLSTAAQRVGCDRAAGSDDLAFLHVFGLQRHNCTWPDSAVRDISITKRQSRMPTLSRRGGVSVTVRPLMWLGKPFKIWLKHENSWCFHLQGQN